VRDRQLASSVSSWHYTAGDIGVFVAHAEAPAEHARAAAQQMWRELQAAREVGFRRSEVARAQGILEARWLRRLETMDGQATYLAAWEADGGIDRASQYYDRLLSLTPDDLQQATTQYLDPAQASVVSVRPDGTPPIAADADALRQWLREAEGIGSSVQAPPEFPTPHQSTPAPMAGAAFAEAPAVDWLVPASMAVDEIDGVFVHRLSSGVSVLVLPRPGAPLVSLGVFQRGGSSVEPAGREGLSRLTAHAMLKGTTTRTGARIAEAAEDLAPASMSRRASRASAGASVPVRHLGAALTLLADVTQHPVFPDDGVDIERPSRSRKSRAYETTCTAGRCDSPRPPPMVRIRIPGRSSGRGVARGDRQASVRRFHADQVVHGATVIAVVGDVDPDRRSPPSRATSTCWPTGRTRRYRRLPWPRAAVSASDRRDSSDSADAALSGPRSTRPVTFHVARPVGDCERARWPFFEQLRDRRRLPTRSRRSRSSDARAAFAAYIATSPAREEEAREAAGVRQRAAAPGTNFDARDATVGTHAIARSPARRCWANWSTPGCSGADTTNVASMSNASRTSPVRICRRSPSATSMRRVSSRASCAATWPDPPRQTHAGVQRARLVSRR
jgi:zinc protease